MIRPLFVSLRSLAFVAIATAAFSSAQSVQADQLALVLPITPALVAGPTNVTIQTPPQPFTLSVEVPHFDTSLGTLDSAILTYAVDFLGEASTPNGGALSGSVGGYFDLDGMPFTGGGGGNGTGGPPGPLSFAFTMIPGDPAGAVIPFLTELSGPGSSVLTYNGDATLILGGSTGATLSATGGSFTVTYNYTRVPEPATAVVLGGGLLAMAMVARRRSK